MGEDASALATSKKGRKGGILLQIKNISTVMQEIPLVEKRKSFA